MSDRYSTAPVRHVAVVGGTHGNETTGLFLARALGRKSQRYSFDVTVDTGNPAAVAANRRYVETDLNREFTLAALADSGRTRYVEGRRARELDAKYGPKAASTARCDFLLDLHNTTSNTDVVAMMHPRDTLAKEVAAHLHSVDGVRVCMWADQDARTLPSVARSGMTLEIGPVAWGVVDSQLYVRSEKLIESVLEYLHWNNLSRKQTIARRTVSVPVFRNAFRAIVYPKKDGLRAIIHPQLAGGDFRRQLRRGDPVFLHHDGTTVEWSEDGAVWPFFINEAAYGGVAFGLATRSDESFDVLTAGTSRM